MAVFKSSQPPINVPEHLPLWDWLFDSPSSPLTRFPASEIKGYTNVATKEHLSYWDVRRHSTHLATELVKNHHLQEADTVVLFSPVTVWYPVAMFAALRAGARVTGVSPASTTEEMAWALKAVEAKYLFTVPASIEVAVAAASQVGIERERIFLLEDRTAGFATMQDLLRQGQAYGESEQTAAFRIPYGQTNRDVCGFLSFSSGTTGLPKTVRIAHANVIAQILQLEQVSPRPYSHIVSVLPVFHLSGLLGSLHMPVCLNVDVFLLPRFTMEAMLQAVQDYRPDGLTLVSPLLLRLVRERALAARYDLSSLRRFVSGAAPVSGEILRRLEETYPGTGFRQGYGMTEACGCIATHPIGTFDDFTYATRAGTIVASTEVKIVDVDSGRPCGVGSMGEVWARGPQITMGYLNNDEATREAFDPDGFLHTGDLGRLDDDGFLVITDRLGEMIHVNGIRVAPSELEDLLLGHDDCEDVAVVGVPDVSMNERPKAFVVLKQGVGGDKHAIGQRLLEFVRRNKPRDKWLVEVEFVDGIPRSTASKILRRLLKDTARRDKRGVVVREMADQAAQNEARTK